VDKSGVNSVQLHGKKFFSTHLRPRNRILFFLFLLKSCFRNFSFDIVLLFVPSRDYFWQLFVALAHDLQELVSKMTLHTGVIHVSVISPMLFLTFITEGSHLLKKKRIEKGISHGISQQGSRCFVLLKNKRFITVHDSDLAFGETRLHQCRSFGKTCQ
jgi:hypothetical protein